MFSTIHHHCLYSPLEQEIYQRHRSTVTQWFASTITRTSISLLISTNITCTRIHPDIYPIKQLNPTTFQIEPIAQQLLHLPEPFFTSLKTTFSRYLHESIK